MLRRCIFIIHFLLSLLVWGQQFHFKNYSVEDGLAQSQVRAIYQSSDGYLWIGTLGGGLSRFDGLDFKNYTVRDGLVDNQILVIFEDEENRIWLGTGEGVCYFDGRKFSPFDNEKELNEVAVNAIQQDKQGRLWFGTEKGAWRYDGKNLEHFTSHDGLPSNTILSIFKDSKEQLWFGTRGGASRLDGSTFINLNTQDGLVDNSVHTIIEDEMENLWFGTGGGLSKYNGESFKNFTEKNGLKDTFIKAALEDHEGFLWFATNEGGICRYNGSVFTSITEDNGLSSNSVWALLEDRENNIWIGTYRGGLDKYSVNPFSAFSAKNGLGDDVVRCIFEDRAGDLWFATYRGGVSRYDGKTFTNFTEKDGLKSNFVLTIYEDKKGNLWFGTYKGVSKYNGTRFIDWNKTDPLSGKIIRSIIEDNKGNIWFGTDSSGIGRFDGNLYTRFSSEDGLTFNRINTLLVDTDDTLWIGTENGLFHYDGQTFIDISKTCGWKYKHIYAILQDAKGVLWIAAYGDGIIRFDPQNKCSSQLLACKQNINTNTAVSLVFDDEEKLWIGSEKGICCLDVDSFNRTGQPHFKHYGKVEGFLGIECIHNAICKDRYGNIWFGTLKGAMKYDRNQDEPNPTEPITHIVDVRFLFDRDNLKDYAKEGVDREGLPVGLELPYDKNHLVFDFIALSFTMPEKIRYRYMLEGLDTDWVEVNEGSYANYSNIPPGRYTFKVIACNNDHVWNKTPSTFSFSVRPPFWKTWWFFLLAALIISGSAFTSIKTRLKYLKKQRKLMEEKVEVSTCELMKEKEKVEKINQELESRVEERTFELVSINESLEVEINERRQVEAALRESEEKFRLVVEHAKDAIFIVQDKMIKFPNPKTIEMLGYTKEDLLKIPFLLLVHPNDVERVKEREAQSLAGKVFSTTYSFRISAKSNRDLWVDLNSIFILWEGKPATLNFLRDITEKKRLEAQLLEAQKMKAIGTLAGGIAHDFNNILMGILGNVSLVLSDSQEKHPDYKELINVEELVQSGTQLTRQLLEFAKGKKHEVIPTNLNRLVEKSAEMFSRTRKEITLHKKFAGNLHTVEVDQGQIEQVLVNLYVNAWQAMPNGGELYLETDNIFFDKNDAETYQVAAGNYARISITDTGEGMDEATKERIFEPFFSTKKLGMGTGLGLASVYSIVTSHGGSVHVYSEKGKGTTFNIYLPSSDKKVVEEVEAPIEENVKEGSETILLVDDEEMITDVGERLLKKLGYKVLIARSGREALEVYSENKDNIHMVILDVIMPGMSGEETFELLKKKYPDVIVLLSSGYSMNGKTAEILEKGCKGFIQKPFRLKQLSQLIRSVLDD